MPEKGNNHQLIKQNNLRLILRHIYMHSPISRVEIAHDLGLTTATITGLVAPLLSQGLLKETEARPEEGKGAGRPRVMLEFAPDSYYCCGVDIGPYQINYVLTNIRGEVIHKRHTTNTLDVYHKTLKLLQDEIPDFLAEAGAPIEKILGIGICLPGLIDGSADKIYTTFYDGWTDHNLASELGKRLGIKIEVENNVRAKAICANLVDRMVQEEPFAYFFASFGVACQMIIDGKVLYGKKAAAGEIGHTVMQRNGPVCPTCGNRGCLEALAGERSILQKCRELMRVDESSVLWSICPDFKLLTIEHILHAQELGDAKVNGIVEDALNYLGIALANMINLISPRFVIAEGRLFDSVKNQKHFLNYVSVNIFRAHLNDTNIQFLPFDSDRGAKAAASVVIEEYLNRWTAE